MGHRVTIEGSQYMPTDLLGRGQRATVEVTPTIRQLVASGGATVVAGSLDDPDAPVYGEPEAVPAAEPVEVAEPITEPEPEAEMPTEPEPEAPQRRRRSSSGNS
ncbi:hypothetical protein [Mycolicibacterium fortuitum]|uniref:hypothetical protein n=1 Tax=Mycolicibacterium fortuitum TaxID=1766 RepID=UPI00261603AB|nr:hypothetical protein [Mycolicibacterium fortuitum]